MKSITFFENNHEYGYCSEGSSPKLLSDLLGWLSSKSDELSELHLALYLFNNEYFFEKLKEISTKGTKVVIYSIPLEGYDSDRPASIRDRSTGAVVQSGTKYDFATELYKTISCLSSSNISLRIVPHMYLRSNRVRSFSRGQMPYSLHCKSFFAKCKNGESFVGLTSTNFAIRDAGKMESLSIISLNEEMEYAAVDFYSGLQENSFTVQEFDEDKDWSHYRVAMRQVPPKSNLMFIAPFYRDSASQFEVNLKTMINRAKRRIVVCAQHVSSYEYSFERLYSEEKTSGYVKKDGFLKDVLQKAKQGADTTIIS